MKQVVVTGGTGYVGRPLLDRLCAEGLRVFAVARPQSVSKVPSACTPIAGEVLDSTTYQDQIPSVAVFVHLVGVAHPAPWKADQFQAIDRAALDQSVVRQSGLNVTILRPWYILGPGHRWPYLLIPFYTLFEKISSTRDAAIRLGLITRAQMVNTLAAAVTAAPARLRVLEPRQIRALGSGEMKL